MGPRGCAPGRPHEAAGPLARLRRAPGLLNAQAQDWPRAHLRSAPWTPARAAQRRARRRRAPGLRR
eukprot:5732480-Alexandrium_andersonii.AAC.1